MRERHLAQINVGERNSLKYEWVMVKVRIHSVAYGSRPANMWHVTLF